MVYLDDPFKAFHSATLEQLLEYKEGERFDRKRRQEAKHIGHLLVGFANANGGLLLLGVEDDRSIIGLKVAYGNDNYRNDIARCKDTVSHVIPEIKFLSITTSRNTDDEIALIFVPASKQLANTSDGDVYLRVGDQNKKLRYEEINLLSQERGQDIPFCNLPSSLSIEPERLHTAVLNDYLARSGISSAQDELDRLLQNRQLAVRHQGEIKLTKAGLLLLAQDARYELPGATIRVQKYEGREILHGSQLNIVQDETFYGPIALVAQRVRDYVHTQLRQFRYLGEEGKFIYVPEFPEEAWFEVIINALVHRAYYMVNDNVNIHIFEDRFEVISPGGYPFGVNPNDFPERDVSRPRNVAIMQFMREIQYVQMNHEGTKRIFAAMAKAGLPAPRYSPVGGTHVTVTLFNDIDRRRAAQASDDSVIPTSNMFRLEFQKLNTSSEDETIDRPPTFHELKDAIEVAIVAAGWSVGSFVRDTAIDFKKPSLIEERDLVSIHDAFTFSLQEFSGKFYLILDYKIEVRNRANLAKIQAIAPQILFQRFGRGFAKVDGRWVACFIQKIDHRRQVVTVELKTSVKQTKLLIEVSYQDVLPDLSSTQQSQLLRAAKTKIDIFREKDRLSVLPPSIRLERIRDLNRQLQRQVFPLILKTYQVYMSLEPFRLVSPDFSANRSLREPAVSFSKQQLNKFTSRGLSSLGAYEKPKSDIPVILMAPAEKMAEMEKLVLSLRNGSKFFNGFKTTFGADLVISEKLIADPRNYRSICEQAISGIPRSPLPIMLFYNEGDKHTGDYQSPFYQVKHYLLQNGVPAQGVVQKTLNNLEWKDMNLSLNLFTKTGHVPWVLDEGLPLADIFIGLSYSSIRVQDTLERIVAYVCVFDKFGRWQYYIGNTEPIPFEERDKRLAQLIRKAVERYSTTASVNHVHIHHGDKLRVDTSQKIAQAIQQIAPNANVYFLHINGKTPLRLFGSQSEHYQVERGTFIRVSNTRSFYLATTGKSELQHMV